MRRKTKVLSTGALLTALSLVVMAMTGVLPTMQYTLVAIAGLLPAIMVIRHGLGAGWYVYAATSILAAILLPDKEAAMLYILLFGHYPMLKSLIERLRTRWIQWAAKLGLCNVLVTAALLLARLLFAQGLDLQELPVGVLFLLVNVVFILYDIGFSRLIYFFYPRLIRGMDSNH